MRHTGTQASARMKRWLNAAINHHEAAQYSQSDRRAIETRECYAMVMQRMALARLMLTFACGPTLCFLLLWAGGFGSALR